MIGKRRDLLGIGVGAKLGFSHRSDTLYLRPPEEEFVAVFTLSGQIWQPEGCFSGGVPKCCSLLAGSIDWGKSMSLCWAIELLSV